MQIGKEVPFYRERVALQVRDETLPGSLQKISDITTALFSKKMKLEKQLGEIKVKKYTWFNRAAAFFRNVFGMNSVPPKVAVDFLDMLKQVHKTIIKTALSEKLENLKILEESIEQLERAAWIKSVISKKAGDFQADMSDLKRSVHQELRQMQEMHKALSRQLEDEGETKKILKYFESVQSSVVEVPATQKHGFKKVKIYQDPESQEIVVDIGGQKIAEGSFKKVKEVYRLTSQGLRTLVRLARKEKTQVSQKEFTTDIAEEVVRRRQLKGVQKLMGITTITYISPKTGEVKTRYFMEKSEGDLVKLLYTNDNLAYPRTPELLKKVLPYCLDALQALSGVHQMNVVSLDVKPENILMVGSEGRLTDLGFSKDLFDPLSKRQMCTKYTGTPGYIAPELLRATKTNPVAVDPSLDMWSVGVMLLEIIDANYGGELLRLGYSVIDSQTGKSQTPVNEAILELEKGVEKIRHDLLARKDPLCPLISRLLSLDPKERASSLETRDILKNSIYRLVLGHS